VSFPAQSLRRPAHAGATSRALLLAGLGLYALFTAAEFTGFGPLPLGELRIPGSLALSFVPLALYLALRHPLLFPFGAYLFTVPVDSLLLNSSGATAARLVAVAAAGVLGMHILARRELRKPGIAWFAWLAVTTWAGLSMAWSIDTASTALLFGTILQLFLLTTILALYPASKADITAVLATVVASGIFAACYGLVGFFSGRVYGTGVSRLSLKTDSGLIVDPNAFATSFVLPIAIAFAALSSSRSVPVRVLSGLAIVLMMVGVLLSGSRGGLLSTLLVLAYYMVRGRQRALTLALGAAGLGLSAFFPTVWARFATDDGAAGSGTGRTFIWATGLRTFKEHFLGGSGFGTYGAVYDKNFFGVYQQVFQGWTRPGHSLIVSSLVELGVIGLALILAAWFLTFRQMRDIRRGSSYYPIRIALEAALVGLFYEALTIDTLYIKYYWLAFALVLMVAAAARKERSEARAVEQPAPD
jgi:O-antigen ligase